VDRGLHYAEQRKTPAIGHFPKGDGIERCDCHESAGFALRRQCSESKPSAAGIFVGESVPGSVDVQWDEKGTKKETQHGNEPKTKMLASKTYRHDVTTTYPWYLSGEQFATPILNRC
jgi:hypothetical protein